MTAEELREAVLRAGGFAEVGERLGVSRQQVYVWLRRVPAERVVGLARVLRVRREDLRPDLYVGER